VAKPGLLERRARTQGPGAIPAAVLSEDRRVRPARPTIGFAPNWQRLVQRKGYPLLDCALLPLGNQTDDAAAAPLLTGLDGAAVTVLRHLNAPVRTGLSAPVQLLIRHALLAPDTGFFDYGCGRGGDIASLQAEGYTAQGWDPHYAADRPVLPAEVVNLGFVVNVIEDPAKRLPESCAICCNLTEPAKWGRGDGRAAISRRLALECA